MQVRSLVAMGCLSAMVAIGLGPASGRATAESNLSGLTEARVGHGAYLDKTNSGLLDLANERQNRIAELEAKLAEALAAGKEP